MAGIKSNPGPFDLKQKIQTSLSSDIIVVCLLPVSSAASRPENESVKYLLRQNYNNQNASTYGHYITRYYYKEEHEHKP